MKGRKAGRVGKTSTPAPTTHLLSRPALTRDGIYANALADLAYERIREAEVLLRHEHFTGAAYIVGYGVELLLKAVIANQRFAGRWPVEAVATDLKIHDLETLLKCASLHELPTGECRPARDETGVEWRRAAGTEVGFVLVHTSPRMSWTRGFSSTPDCATGRAPAPEHIS
jgi:hypothetical protein